MEPLITLFDATRATLNVPVLPPDLLALYGGDLVLPEHTPKNRPAIIANFVASLDGITSFSLPGSDMGNKISGDSAIDHVVMGILRASADAVLWGSNMYMTARRYLATPATVWPAGTEDFRALRERLGKEPVPLAVIVTGSGAIDTTGDLFQQADQPTVVITTHSGAARLAPALPSTPNLRILDVADGTTVPPADVVRVLYEQYGVQTLLHEGGPSIFGAFLQEGLIDELFLTIAPQFAGRTAEAYRPSLVEQVSFTPATAPWARLISLKQDGSHLFTRYSVVGPR